MANTYVNLLIHTVFSTKNRQPFNNPVLRERLYPYTKKYIEDQEVHHSKVNFQEEYLEFLRKNNIVFDEKYVFGYGINRPYGTDLFF